MKVKRAPVSKAADAPLETFEHTHIAVYLCGLFAVACVCYDSIQVKHRQAQTSCKVLLLFMQHHEV